MFYGFLQDYLHVTESASMHKSRYIYYILVVSVVLKQWQEVEVHRSQIRLCWENLFSWNITLTNMVIWRCNRYRTNKVILFMTLCSLLRWFAMWTLISLRLLSTYFLVHCKYFLITWRENEIEFSLQLRCVSFSDNLD